MSICFIIQYCLVIKTNQLELQRSVLDLIGNLYLWRGYD